MAKRSQFYAVATDTEGNSLEDITVTVYNVGTSVEASIYALRSGGGTVPSSFETGADGEISFWADPGSYDIELHDATIPARIGDKTITWDSISGDAFGIDGNQIEALGIDAFRMADDSIFPRNIVLSTQTGTLGADVTLLDGGAWYNGPTLTVNQGNGVYDIRAYHKIVDLASSNTVVRFQSRLVNGLSPFDTKEYSTYRGSGGTTNEGFPFSHSRFATVNDGTTLTLQGMSIIGLVAEISASGAYITATRIG